jgi:Heparinase II/III N-terminus/Heparinase II/III-like protein
VSEYTKPYFTGRLQQTLAAVHYPYPEGMLGQCDIFPLFVLDGGAFFSTADRLGGATGKHFLDALEDGSLLRPWLEGSRLVWDKVYDQTHGSPCQTMIEQHVWLNRLYFLMPIAQRYFQTGDEKWAKSWFSYFADWVRANPYMDEGLAGARERTKFTWFDMQITWRLLVMIHSVKFLAGSTFMKRKHWRQLYDAIDQHSRCLYREASASLAKQTGHGNHFLQQGTALIYTGALFPELPGAEDFVATGRGIVKQQLDSEILADGGSIEGSPSYSHFIARLYLDAYLLLKDNGLPAIPGLQQGIKRQYRHLAALATPQGLTMQVSDSYAMDVHRDLDIVRSIFPLPKSYPNRSACFSDSQMIVLKNKRLSVYVDAMPNKSHHIHPGKPNILIYVGNEPLLIDSGCPSYDRELWESWYRSAPAHNAVTVCPARAKKGGGGDKPLVSDIKIKQCSPSKAVIEHRVKADGWRYLWVRAVSLGDRAVTVRDTVEASVAVDVKLYQHVVPVNVVLARNGKRAVVQLEQGDVTIDQASGHGGGVFELSPTPAIGPDNRVCVSNQLMSSAHGKRVTMKVRMKLLS